MDDFTGMVLNMLFSLPESVRDDILKDMPKIDGAPDFQKMMDRLTLVDELNRLVLSYVSLIRTLTKDINTEDTSLTNAQSNLEKFKRLQVMSAIPMAQISDKMKEMHDAIEQDEKEANDREKS